MSLIKILLSCILVCKAASGTIYLMCAEGQIVQQEGCVCWNPEEPIIACLSLGLTTVPYVTKANTLILDGNNISNIQTGPFKNLKDLKILGLSKNSIKHIPDDSFSGLESTLESLDLSYNELTNVPLVFNRPETKQLKMLTRLSLSKNFIFAIGSEDFKNLPNLKFLELDGNNIRTYSVNSWVGLWSLEKLTLSPTGMDITTIPTKNLERLQGLTLIDGQPQKITHLNPWFTTFKELKHLGLIRMGLQDEHFARGDFPESWKTQLLGLVLRDNILHNVPLVVNTILGLQELDLSNNFIDRFHGSHWGLPNMRKFNISNNGMTRLDDNILLQMTHATSIDISNNDIPWMNWSLSDIIQSFPRRMVLRIGGNQFKCSCGNNYKWPKLLINRQHQTDNGFLTMYEINNTIRCGSGGSYVGRLFRDVPESVFSCSRRR